MPRQQSKLEKLKIRYANDLALSLKKFNRLVAKWKKYEKIEPKEKDIARHYQSMKK